MVQWDLAHPLWLGLKGHVMSIEVAEHLAAEHHDTFMDTLSRHCTGKLVLTWATVGQGGLRHIAEVSGGASAMATRDGGTDGNKSHPLH